MLFYCFYFRYFCVYQIFGRKFSQTTLLARIAMCFLRFIQNVPSLFSRRASLQSFFIYFQNTEFYSNLHNSIEFQSINHRVTLNDTRKKNQQRKSKETNSISNSLVSCVCVSDLCSRTKNLVCLLYFSTIVVKKSGFQKLVKNGVYILIINFSLNAHTFFFRERAPNGGILISHVHTHRILHLYHWKFSEFLRTCIKKAFIYNCCESTSSKSNRTVYVHLKFSLLFKSPHNNNQKKKHYKKWVRSFGGLVFWRDIIDSFVWTNLPVFSMCKFVCTPSSQSFKQPKKKQQKKLVVGHIFVQCSASHGTKSSINFLLVFFFFFQCVCVCTCLLSEHTTLTLCVAFFYHPNMVFHKHYQHQHRIVWACALTVFHCFAPAIDASCYYAGKVMLMSASVIQLWTPLPPHQHIGRVIQDCSH